MMRLGLVRTVRAYCLIELAALLPFAVPGWNHLHITMLDQANQFLGGAAFPTIDPLHLTLGGVLGFISLGFVIVRWRMLTRELAMIEGAIRLGVTAWLVWAGIILDAPLLLIIAVIDGVGGVLHLWFARRS